MAAHRGWLSGWQGVFDTSKSKLVKNNLALGYAIGDFALHCNVNDGQIFGASLYQKVKYLYKVRLAIISMVINLPSGEF